MQENQPINSAVETKIKKTMEELAELGVMMSVAVLTPSSQGFGFLYATNIPKTDLRARVLEQAMNDEMQSQGLSKSKIINPN